VGLIPESEASTHPLVGFKVHAVKTNEIFLLVADLIAKGLTQLIPLAHTLPSPQQILPPFGVWEVSGVLPPLITLYHSHWQQD